MPQHRHRITRVIFCVISCIAIVLTGNTQSPQFGVFAGPQMSSANYFVTESKQSTEYKYGFHAGFTMKVPFETNLYFSPAAYYSMKGYKASFKKYAYPPDMDAIDNDTRIHTFNLAFLLQYNMGSKPSHFFLKAGPVLDFQLKGKETYHLMNGNTVSKNMVYSFGEYGRYGASLFFQLGFETRSGFFVAGQYDLGITDINNADLGPRINHRVFGLTFGTYFKNKKIVLDTRNKE
ncbi:MAG: PorT family protein [Chitinophagaceae bacterium]|nr:PorT family protein [Chitinophagaceae bacterium]